MTKKTKTRTKDKVKKAAATPPHATAAHTEKPDKDVPADPDENMKWMTAGRLLLAVATVVGALAVRGWVSARRAGHLPGPGPVRDARDVLQTV